MEILSAKSFSSTVSRSFALGIDGECVPEEEFECRRTPKLTKHVAKSTQKVVMSYPNPEGTCTWVRCFP